jgi:large subunit ribosomal protein L5
MHSGNYNLGLEEQIVFPEINYDTIDKVRGLQITIVTSTQDNTRSLPLIRTYGYAF